MNRSGMSSFLRHCGPAVAPATVLAAAAIAWFLDHGTPGRRDAILFAAATCLGGGLAAWCVRLVPVRTPAGRVAAALSGITLRLLPALAALAWLQTSGSRLRAAGGGELLLVFYLAALAADLARIIMGTGRAGGSPGGREVI